MIEFQYVPCGSKFYDPYVMRVFIKINDNEAKCISYPVRWNDPINLFDTHEKVYISK